MSIIHEALKKVQANLQGQQKQDPAPPAVPTGPSSTSAVVDIEAPVEVLTKKTGPHLPNILIAIAIMTGLFLLLSPKMIPHPTPAAVATPTITPAPSKTALANPKAGQKITPKPTQTTPSTEKPTTAQTPPANSLDVQGIMNNNGKSVALINDKIYEEGAEINGVKIQTISAGAVTILRDGQEETIMISH